MLSWAKRSQQPVKSPGPAARCCAAPRWPPWSGIHPESESPLHQLPAQMARPPCQSNTAVWISWGRRARHVIARNGPPRSRITNSRTPVATGTEQRHSSKLKPSIPSKAHQVHTERMRSGGRSAPPPGRRRAGRPPHRSRPGPRLPTACGRRIHPGERGISDQLTIKSP